MLLAIFAVSSCSTGMVRLVTQSPSVKVPGYRLSRWTLRGWRLRERHHVSLFPPFFFLFSPRSPVASRYPDGRQPGRFALGSRFDGKAERRLVAENMLKIERQAV
jgi:hypothetical protein